MYYSSSGKPRSERAGSLSAVIRSLQKAATWDFPAALFGNGVIATYVRDFGQSNKFNPRKQLETALNRIVMEAVAVIQKILPIKEEEIDGVVYTWGATEHFDKFNKYTYFPLDETYVP